VRVWLFISMVLYTLVAGVFWGTWFSLSRSIASIRAETFLDIGHTMIGNLGGPMSLLMPAAIVSVGVVAALLYRRGRSTAAGLAGLALILLIAALAITLSVNVPIDSQIAKWTPGTLPADWQAIRDRWEFYHGLRTFLSVAGSGCLFASALCSGVGERSGSRVAGDHGHR
jgi:uncharacterized membrane protein